MISRQVGDQPIHWAKLTHKFTLKSYELRLRLLLGVAQERAQGVLHDLFANHFLTIMSRP